MSAVSEDRWTCPGCGRTTVVDGSQADIRCALDAVQVRHDKGHRPGANPEHGSEVIAALGLPDPTPPPSRPSRRGRGRSLGG